MVKLYDSVLLRVLDFRADGCYILLVVEEKPTGNSIGYGRNNRKTFGRNRERDSNDINIKRTILKLSR